MKQVPQVQSWTDNRERPPSLKGKRTQTLLDHTIYFPAHRNEQSEQPEKGFQPLNV